MYSLRASILLGTLTQLFLGVTSQAVYSIDPSSVPQSIRNSWCSSQTTSCPLLCLQYPGQSSTTADNTCDPKTLTYSCVCDNGQSPNASEYSQTLPFFVCQEYGSQCVTACNGNTQCQSACREDHPCGAQNPTRVNATTTTSSSSQIESATSSVPFTGLGGATATSDSDSSKSGSLAALDPARGFISAIIFTGIFAGFALMI